MVLSLLLSIRHSGVVATIQPVGRVLMSVLLSMIWSHFQKLYAELPSHFRSGCGCAAATFRLVAKGFGVSLGVITSAYTRRATLNGEMVLEDILAVW